MDIDRHIRVIQPLWISRMYMFSSDKEYGYANTPDIQIRNTGTYVNCK